MFKVIHRILKKFRKEIYLIEYQVHNSFYRVIIKAGEEEKWEDVFDKKWSSSCFGIYPYPMYKIIDVKKVNKKIEII